MFVKILKNILIKDIQIFLKETIYDIYCHILEQSSSTYTSLLKKTRWSDARIPDYLV